MANELEFDVLDEGQVQAALAGLPGWEAAAPAIMRCFSFSSFLEAIAFVNRVAVVAEQFNHHPVLEINFRRVAVRLWTHKKNATTQADFTVAQAIDKVA